MHRRYRAHPHIPFLIAQKPVGTPVSGLNASPGTSGAPEAQTASDGEILARRVLLAILFFGGMVAGAGIGLEVWGFRLAGNVLYFAGFLACAFGIVRHPANASTSTEK